VGFSDGDSLAIIFESVESSRGFARGYNVVGEDLDGVADLDFVVRVESDWGSSSGYSVHLMDVFDSSWSSSRSGGSDSEDVSSGDVGSLADTDGLGEVDSWLDLVDGEFVFYSV